MVWSVFWGPFFGDHFLAEAFPCSVAFVFFGAGALSCSVALVFGSFIFFPVNLVVVCGTNEGVQKIYKTNVFLHFLKKMRGRKRQNYSKYIGKINTLHPPDGRSLASICARPFFWSPHRLLQWSSKKRPKQFILNGFEGFRGAPLGRPCWTMLTKKAFPCSVALVFHFCGALPCSVALVLRFGKAFPCSVALVFRFWLASMLSGCCRSGG